MTEYLAENGYGKLGGRDSICVENACVSGNSAIGIAFRRIREGTWKRALAGAVDMRIQAHSLMGMHLLGALTIADVPPEEASRPFSKDRSGFVKGQGGALLVLESREEAESRGADILGVVAGFGQTSDGWRLTDGREDGSGIVRAMEGAMKDAGIEKEQVSYINAHGTSTVMNDALETLAIKKVFGSAAYRIPVSSLKSQIGHLNVACGAVEVAACVAMLRHQRVAPTINYRVPDPDCDLDYVPNIAREAKLDYVLNNNFGFGGQNSCLVIKGAHLS
jgi:3-oxoacyl-[acyl-carrier-protein] synthase II